MRQEQIGPGAAVAVVLGLAVAGTAAARQAAPELDAPAALQRLQGWLDETADLEGRFTQTLVSGALGAGLEERGRIYIRRPGRMRWDYVDPERKVAIVDGGHTWLYVAEEEQLILGRLDGQGELLPALLAGGRPIDELFEASLVATPRLGGEGAYRLQLRPRGAAEPVEQVTLTLRPPRFAIEAADVLDAAGNRMLYRFSSLKRNRGLRDGLFRFEPPAGTHVTGRHEAGEER